MNKWVGVGNLTKDIDSSKTNNDIDVCRFTMACQRPYKADGQPDADFIPVVVWRNQAVNCAKYLSKGSKVAVSGTLQIRSWEDREGTKHYTTEVIADNVEFLNTAKKEEPYCASPKVAVPQPTKIEDLTPIDDNTDLPF